jgi:hypothetical protein
MAARAAGPLDAGEIDTVIIGIEALFDGGIDDLLLFQYPRDWTKGERVWTPAVTLSGMSRPPHSRRRARCGWDRARARA